MKATELADDVDDVLDVLVANRILNPSIEKEVLRQAATMLREQQRTIDGDKRLIDLLYKKIEQLQAQLAQANRVYDFDNPLLDKAQEK